VRLAAAFNTGRGGRRVSGIRPARSGFGRTRGRDRGLVGGFPDADRV